MCTRRPNRWEKCANVDRPNRLWEGHLEIKLNVEEKRRDKVTGQCFANSVPAAFGSGKVGSQPLISNDSRALVVESLATVASNVASVSEALHSSQWGEHNERIPKGRDCDHQSLQR